MIVPDPDIKAHVDIKADIDVLVDIFGKNKDHWNSKPSGILLDVDLDVFVSVCLDIVLVRTFYFLAL